MPRDDDDNLLTLLFSLARRAWWHRPGYEAIGQVLDTFESLGFATRHGQKPVLAHKHRTPAGWHLVFALPPGISSQDVSAKLSHFQEQAGAAIELKTNGRLLHMDIRTTPMPERAPYSWDPAEYPKLTLPLPIGHTPAGPVVIDLPSLPHLFVAGNVGGGKTTFLRAAVVSLLATGNVLPVIIDLKGLDFHHLHTSGHALVVDTDDGAMAALSSLNREMDRRRDILKRAGATKLQEYRGHDLPWIVALIDELAELQQREAQEALNRLARLSRATGICLIVATQRPSHTLFSRFTDTRMLFSGRLCFHVPKPEDSRLILDSDAAARLPPSIPGRAIWRWDREVEVQCLHLSPVEAQKILAGIPAPGVIAVESRATRLPPR